MIWFSLPSEGYLSFKDDFGWEVGLSAPRYRLVWTLTHPMHWDAEAGGGRLANMQRRHVGSISILVSSRCAGHPLLSNDAVYRGFGCKLLVVWGGASAFLALFRTGSLHNVDLRGDDIMGCSWAPDAQSPWPISWPQMKVLPQLGQIMTLINHH